MLKLRSLFTIDSVNRACVVKYNTFSAYYAQELDLTGELTHARYGKIIDIFDLSDKCLFHACIDVF